MLGIMSALQSNSPDAIALMAALAQARDLCVRLKLRKDAATFSAFITRFQKQMPTYDVLQRELKDATNGMITMRILMKLGIGKDHSEFHRLQDAFYKVMFPESDGDAVAESLEARVDEHGDKIMASSEKAEARKWLKSPSHAFFKADRGEVARFVEEFCSAGAKQVVIADIDEHEGIQYGEGLLVVLPLYAAARDRLFQIGSRADEAFQNDSVTDKGQKYLYYSLD